MKKLYFLLYSSFSVLGFSQTILNQSESTSRTVQDPNVVILAPGFYAASTVSNTFVAKIGTATENTGGGPNAPSTAGSTNPSETIETDGNRFHDTQGNIDVNGGGQLQFTLPIALPPGVKSVAPQINLVYTSGGGNGIAGYGWNISGITSISRMGKNIEKDGEVKGIQLDYSDYYSFNGQRLILKHDSPAAYGQNGAKYVTEKFSNIKIKSLGTIAGQIWQGPEYWEVTFEDGSQAWYGAITTGASTARTPVEYNIVKWKDAQTNYISYNYTQDTGTNVAQIANITWGGNETVGVAHFNKIDFIYYNDRGLKEFSYIKGIEFIQNKLLKDIIVKTNIDVSEEQFKKYNIGYEESTIIDNNQTKTIGYKFVNKITEFNSDNSLANPITFATKPLTTSTSDKAFGDFNDVITSGDYNGDGSVDFLLRQPAQNGKPEGYYIYFDAVNNVTPSSVYLGTTNTYFPSSTFVTFNIKPQDNIIKARQGLVIIKNNSEYNPPSTGDIEVKYYSIKSDASVLNTTNSPLVLEYSKIISASSYEYQESSYPHLPDPTYDYFEEANKSVFQNAKEIDIDSDGISELILSIQDSKCFNQIIIADPLKTRWNCSTLGYTHLVIDNEDIASNTIHIVPPIDKNILAKGAIMDFDNDGVQDIMFIKENGTTNVSFYTKHRDPSFSNVQY